jgi:hypothetical protein
MKNFFQICGLSLCCITISRAATTIYATNAVAGPNGFVEQIRVGDEPFVNGVVMSGTFTSTPLLGGGASLHDFGWTMFASEAFSNNAIAPGIFGSFAGAGQSPGMTGTLPTTPTGPFIGNDIYLVIALPSGEDYIIWNSGIKFAVEYPVIGGAAVSIHTRDATLLRGAMLPGENAGLGGPLAAFNGGTAIGSPETSAAIPEPSAAFLTALGALAMFRRRVRRS